MNLTDGIAICNMQFNDIDNMINLKASRSLDQKFNGSWHSEKVKYFEIFWSDCYVPRRHLEEHTLFHIYAESHVKS